VLRRLDAAITAGLEAEAQEVRQDLQASIHKITGRMARESFADVEVRGGKRTLVLGSDAPYAAYEELGTSRREGHPVIRQTADQHAPHITQRIAQAVGRGR
jgi:HK97 gp10 family phage protein